MPSVTYMNHSAPFWDFIASLEQGSQNHPSFSQNQPENEANNEHGEHHNHHRGPPPPGPWGWGFPWGAQDLPHRGPPPHDQTADESQDEKEKVKDNTEKDNANDNGEGPSNTCTSDNEGCPRKRNGHGRCGGGRRGRHGWGPYGRGGFGGGGGCGHRGGPHHHGRGGGWGPWAHRGGPFGGGPPPFNPFAYAAGLFDPSTSNDNASSEDFTPEADIFDTPSAFIIHISLPGAKKEDVGVNWDIEKSELSIAGVVYRPADEELLKLLDMSERKVGPFERKIRLGTRANPAQIDSEGITAKLEDGVLRIEVPKLEKEGFVEVRKVDIE